jgi:hypothetical protein
MCVCVCVCVCERERERDRDLVELINCQAISTAVMVEGKIFFVCKLIVLASIHFHGIWL